MESHDIRWDNYFYPGTNVLKNKLGITDADELQQVEADITFSKLTELYINPIEGNFDATHYRDIHRYLFEDIYPFAGEFRNVDMRKDFYFVTNSEIEASLDTVLNEMHQDFLKCQCYRDYVIFLAEFYYDILTVHPFREGNGRTTREFLREFVDKYMKDYKLKWSKMDKEQLHMGVKYGYVGKSLIEIEIAKGLVSRREELSSGSR